MLEYVNELSFDVFVPLTLGLGFYLMVLECSIVVGAALCEVSFFNSGEVKFVTVCAVLLNWCHSSVCPAGGDIPLNEQTVLII